MKNQQEIWKDVKGYEGLYRVSSLGSIYSLISKKYLIQHLSTSGYLFVNLYKNKKPKHSQIHSIVAQSFLNHTPNGQTKVIDHIDNNRTNNSLSNIQILTQRQNTNKSMKIGTSGVRGVSWSIANKKWQSKTRINGKRVNIGYYDCKYCAEIDYNNIVELIESTGILSIEDLKKKIKEYKLKLKQ